MFSLLPCNMISWKILILLFYILSFICPAVKPFLLLSLQNVGDHYNTPQDWNMSHAPTKEHHITRGARTVQPTQNTNSHHTLRYVKERFLRSNIIAFDKSKIIHDV